MNWCFGLVNGRLAEIFFEKKGRIFVFLGHTYIRGSDYKTKREKYWIKNDIDKIQLSYSKGMYKKTAKIKLGECLKNNHL